MWPQPQLLFHRVVAPLLSPQRYNHLTKTWAFVQIKTSIMHKCFSVLSYSAPGLGLCTPHHLGSHMRSIQTPPRVSFWGLRWTLRSWDKMAGLERDVESCFRARGGWDFVVRQRKRATPSSGAAWQTSINNITDFYDLWSPWQRKATIPRSKSLSLNTAKSKLGNPLIFPFWYG